LVLVGKNRRLEGHRIGQKLPQKSLTKYVQFYYFYNVPVSLLKITCSTVDISTYLHFINKKEALFFLLYTVYCTLWNSFLPKKR
jgi:hypothetical protein